LPKGLRVLFDLLFSCRRHLMTIGIDC